MITSPVAVSWVTATVIIAAIDVMPEVIIGRGKCASHASVAADVKSNVADIKRAFQASGDLTRALIWTRLNTDGL